MFKLVISDDEGKTTVVPLVREEITIGRKEGNTIRLTERNVSRRHARIQRKTNDYVLEDLASYNGIVVNGARLADARAMRHGDQILIGDYKLQIVEEAGVQAPMPTSLPPTPSEPIVPLLAAVSPTTPTLATANTSGAGHPVGLAALNDPFAQPPGSRPSVESAPSNTNSNTPQGAQVVPESIKGMRVVFLAPAGVPAPVMLDRLPLVLGRSEAADIALPFSSISREHAKLFLENDKLLIQDLDSANGVQVNGEKTLRSELAPGDMVQLGVVEFRVARRGDSTVVIQKLALEEKARAQRNPVALFGGVLGGGAVLGLLVFFAFKGFNLPPPTVVPVLNQSPLPSGPGAIVVPTPIQPPARLADPPRTSPEINLNPIPNPIPVLQAPVGPTAPPQAPTPPELGPQVVNPVPQTLQPPQAPQTPPRHVRVRTPQTPAQNPPQNPPQNPNARVTPPTNPPTPGPPSTPSESPIVQARTCLRGPDRLENNACVIRVLAGRASNCQELGMLAGAYRDSQQASSAIRTMQRYLRDCSSGPFVTSFENYITEHRR